MNRYYADILERIDGPPLWFDENAVPRYCAFSPDWLDIYAREAALVLIECQSCQRQFTVAFSRSSMDDVLAHGRGLPARTLEQGIREKSLHYGDPPNVHCCPSGPTMNSEPLRVMEYWVRGKNFTWERKPELEVRLDER